MQIYFTSGLLCGIFSFDEMARYDLPAMIDFTLKKTKQSSLHYVGHSQGTMIMFALLSTNQEFAAKVCGEISLFDVCSKFKVSKISRRLLCA